MGLRVPYLLDLIVGLLCCPLAFFLWRWAASLETLPARKTARIAVLLAMVCVSFGAAFAVVRIASLFDSVLVTWVRCAGIVAAASLFYAFVCVGSMRRLKMFDPGRRQALKVLAAPVIAAPVGAAGFAVIRRNDLVFREIDLQVRGLPHDLNGLRIAQITDIHMGPFIDEQAVRRAVGMANEARPHLTFVTGDLITTRGDPLDLCLRCLKDLRADSGVFCCMGNHERYAKAEAYTERESALFGHRYLRGEAVKLRFGSAVMNLVGVDYQRRGEKYLDGVDTLVAPGEFNVLLSHNPDVFPVAARQGFDLTISGHTHGGQVTFEIIHPALNIVRFVTPFVYGQYEKENKQLYVSRGIGTIGVPARLGAQPEVVLLRLCAI